MKKYIMAVVLLVATSISFAWDGSVHGNITQVDVSGASNYAFRVQLGGQKMCGNSHSWAYINKANDNYEVYVSALLSAKHSGTPVIIYSNKNGTQGYCKIGYVVLK